MKIFSLKMPISFNPPYEIKDNTIQYSKIPIVDIMELKFFFIKNSLYNMLTKE